METTATPPAAAPRTDRFLIGILAGLAALLVVAGVAVALLRRPAPALPAGTPGAAVQEFYRAMAAQDYDRAYALLSDEMPNKPTREEFARYNADRQPVPPDRQQRVRIGREQVTGGRATVVATVTTFVTDPAPFGGASEYTTTETFSLQHEAAGWRITGLPYTYWPPYPFK